MTVSSLAVLIRVTILLLLGFVAFCLLLYWLQEGMLFFPERASLETVRREAHSAGFRLWPEDGERYRALLAEPTGQVAGTCVIWHGNAGSARQRDYLALPLLRLGWRVVVVEYPGYGARPNGSLREAALVVEARTLTEEVQQHFGGPIVVIGESLGAAIAAAVAGNSTAAVSGAILLTPWFDLAGVARVHYSWLPVRLLLRDRFDNAAALAGFHGPVVVVTAGSDEIIPASEGRRLFQTVQAPGKRLHEIPGARHNDWVERISSDDWQNWMNVAAGHRRELRIRP